MNKKFIPLIIVTTFLLVLPFVSAAELTGGTLRSIGETITEVFKVVNIQVKIPHPGYGVTETVSILQVVAVFMLLFAMFWAGINRVKIFDKEGLKGAKKTFTIALTLLVIFASPVIEWVSGWVTTLAHIAIILAIVVAIMLLVNMTKKGAAGAGEIGAEAAAQKAKNLKMFAEAHKNINDLGEKIRRSKYGRRARRSLRKYMRKLMNNERTIEQRLKLIREMIPRIGRLIKEGKGDESEKIIKDAIKEINTLIHDILTSQDIEKNIKILTNVIGKDSYKVMAGTKEVEKGIFRLYAELEKAKEYLDKSTYADEKTKERKIRELQEVEIKIGELAKIRTEIERIETALIREIEIVEANIKIDQKFLETAKALMTNLEQRNISVASHNVSDLINLWNERIQNLDEYEKRIKGIMEIIQRADQLRSVFAQIAKELEKRMKSIARSIYKYKPQTTKNPNPGGGRGGGKSGGGGDNTAIAKGGDTTIYIASKGDTGRGYR